MADLDYYGADYGAEPTSRISDALRNFGLVNWIGAGTSLGLAAALSIWAVDLTFRDMSNVPVIARVDGPMRVAPADPGGTQAPFQGMALSDITSGGAAAPAPEEIVLAPSPVDLSAPTLAERRQAAGLEAAPVADAVTQAQAAPAQAPSAITTPEPLDMAALAEQLAAGQTPLDEIVGASAPATQALPTPDPILTAPQPEVAAAPVFTGPGLARSARPTIRPSARRIAAPATTVAPTEAPAAAPTRQVASLGGVDVDPNSVAPGTRVVQLGAYDSEAAARSEWDRMTGRFGDYMSGKQRLVQKARSGGRDFWRLRVVGFADGSDARRFCSALLAKDAACIPVTMR
ncbi:sporulation protein [Jannaschia pagri]|uniref:Sporulation protein n=1 Tax=Jannaschia pagri TaxID=2829797 RepID=A0ABQ4NGX1_9RHOB|nr:MULTISPECIES: SPOR domain-containing protein [unclassified Jannaschia]GIT90446.1 sporulation protein [Jannaschia sp. AI_61]GIT93449.1 sporulation protein [Jannaschia sp. AI_62]